MNTSSLGGRWGAEGMDLLVYFKIVKIVVSIKTRDLDKCAKMVA
jgi:hypothetical protein